MITGQQLKQIAPTVQKASVYAPLLAELMPKWGIDTPQRVQAFLAQLLHESGAFKYVREIHDGSNYEGRLDLGNSQQGDGKRFRGRGLIQVTGRTNYKACSLALFGDQRLLKTPELLEQPRYAVESACWFWKSRDLNSIADLPDTWVKVVERGNGNTVTYTKFQWLTKKINGGQNGYAERLHFWQKAKQVL
jgi:putative chitinase